MTVLDRNQSHHHITSTLQARYHEEWGSQPLVSIKSLGTTLGAHLIEIQCFEHGEQECRAVEICNGLP